ncbi:hypothetical protein PsYK624_105690 [Phanerochaete sordida]|uniref:Uncharacterized protein n=1 Tax=Phanerochaete sordida TaxID=48140 RepID=A0A9P3GGA7_9APHY|nr:hypothetical protein PsYK624_105690 [Phanerochaete sordida]
MYIAGRLEFFILLRTSLETLPSPFSTVVQPRSARNVAAATGIPRPAPLMWPFVLAHVLLPPAGPHTERSETPTGILAQRAPWHLLQRECLGENHIERGLFRSLTRPATTWSWVD